MVIAMALMAIVFAVLVPQLRAIQRSWDSKAGSAETLQNGRVLLDHLQRKLASAKQISAVSSPADTEGFIQFLDSGSNICRFGCLHVDPKYIQYGPIGQPADLAGPVSRFQITCYDINDLDTPLDPVLDPREVHYVKVETTLSNSAGMGQDLTLTASAYLRTGGINTGTTTNLLFVVPDAENLDSQDNFRKTLMQTWGYDVTLISADSSQAQFDAAVANADVAYISSQVAETDLGTKLTNAAIGVVNEQVKLHLDFQFSEYVSFATRQQVNIVNNTHYITSEFGLGLLTLFNLSQPVHMLVPPLAPGLVDLARTERTPGNFEPSLAILTTGAELYGGGTAAGRRVQLPWGDDGFDINMINAYGRTIMKRSIEWAADNESGGEPGPGEGNYRDEFNTSSYSGNDGTLNWKGDWQEINESDGAVRGDEVVTEDPLASPRPPSLQLRVRDNDGGGEGVMRQANLDGAATATLSLLYRRSGLDDASDYVAVEVSPSGIFGPWTEIVRFAGPDNESAYQPFSQDISAYIDSDFAIRFISSPDLGDRDDVWFDEVEIQLSQ